MNFSLSIPLHIPFDIFERSEQHGIQLTSIPCVLRDMIFVRDNIGYMFYISLSVYLKDI